VKKITCQPYGLSSVITDNISEQYDQADNDSKMKSTSSDIVSAVVSAGSGWATLLATAADASNCSVSTWICISKLLSVDAGASGVSPSVCDCWTRCCCSNSSGVCCCTVGSGGGGDCISSNSKISNSLVLPGLNFCQWKCDPVSNLLHSKAPSR